MEYQKQKETPYEVLVYESLKQKILSGGYAAGEKIPEQSVSEELGVSHPAAGKRGTDRVLPVSRRICQGLYGQGYS